MALVQHWLVAASVRGDPRTSLTEVCPALRALASRLAASLTDPEACAARLAEIGRVLARTCRRNPRSQPGTRELLNDPSRLDFQLT